VRWRSEFRGLPRLWLFTTFGVEATFDVPIFVSREISGPSTDKIGGEEGDNDGEKKPRGHNGSFGIIAGSPGADLAKRIAMSTFGTI
jgi:hypothetical protein